MFRPGFRLGLLALGGATVLLGAVAGVVGLRFLDAPDAALAPTGEGPTGVPHGIAEVLMRQAGASSRSDPVALSVSDLNAFLARHFEAPSLPAGPLVVRTGEGWLEVAGRTSLRRLLARGSVRGVERVLPDAALDLDLWLGVRGRLLTGDGEVRLVVERAAIGRQPVAPTWFWRILGVAPEEVLTWRVPRVVTRVDVETGRLLVYTRPRRG